MRTIHTSICLIILLTSLFTNPVQAQEKRRWSPQAKGTAIGVGAGGAAGAIINKRNRAVGGVIGGLAGGAVGYGIGKGVDNQRKTNARIAAAEREAAETRREVAENKREAAEARREAQLARQEAAAAADRPAVVTRPAAARVAAVRKAPVPAVSEVAAATGFSSALAATAFSAQTVSDPYNSNGNALFLTNPSYGDQATAYPTSEVRRKSW